MIKKEKFLQGFSMKELTSYLNQPLLLKQLSFFKRKYELKNGEEIIGTMQIRGFFGNSAEVGFGEKKWEIYKPSIWKRDWHIREAGYEVSFAHLEQKFFKRPSTVFLPVGEKINIVFPFFKSKIEIQSESGECLIRMVNKFSWTDSSEVIVTSTSPTVNKYPWLIMLAKIVSVERKQSRSAVVSFKIGGF